MSVFTNQTEIANLALSHVGANNTIDAFSERSVEAAQMRVWYDISRKTVLSAFDWNFARKRIELAAHSEDPPTSVWAFRYQYPADCLVARKLEFAFAPPADAVPFTVETDATGQEKTILTDLAEATLVYTFDQESPVLWSPFFIMTLSHLLAHHIAFVITAKRSVAVDQLTIYQSLLLAAPAQNANEQVSPPPREAEHIRAR